MADDVFGKPCAFDQGVEIDTGFDAELVTKKDEIFGTDSAGSALMAGERAAAETGD